MSATSFSCCSARPNALLALAVVVGLAAPQSVALTASPFGRFAGEWSGGGQIVGTNGHRESIRCRAEYVEAKEGAALNQTIVCASESFKFDIRSHVEASGESAKGYWSEVSRNVSGSLTGRIAENQFEGQISSLTFSAAISLISNGRTQAVSIRPSGGDVADVRIEFQRRG